MLMWDTQQIWRLSQFWKSARCNQLYKCGLSCWEITGAEQSGVCLLRFGGGANNLCINTVETKETYSLMTLESVVGDHSLLSNTAQPVLNAKNTGNITSVLGVSFPGNLKSNCFDNKLLNWEHLQKNVFFPSQACTWMLIGHIFILKTVSAARFISSIVTQLGNQSIKQTKLQRKVGDVWTSFNDCPVVALLIWDVECDIW